ncbi:hypothetical protein GK047_04940 [Paenibacillus sp. SYP-B3998]|uniref:Uncharacterized protein n=1 Tax=Paenibacillus sp. SYP-B3998 TaxID=2678564 RepID=A0A6G3ZT98_9BACL|nr:hypothetical protein [Paenibacillus sp. SYP-B3998]NEW05362.1 hypothetical protein [Paenibacillus sp. SYP-B3998]
MREIDINHLLIQLGISKIAFMKWQAEQAQQHEELGDSMIVPQVDTFTELMSDASLELTL